MLYSSHFLPLFTQRGQVARVTVWVRADRRTCEIKIFPRRYGIAPVLTAEADLLDSTHRAELIALCPPSYHREVARLLDVIRRDVAHACRTSRLWRVA